MSDQPAEWITHVVDDLSRQFTAVDEGNDKHEIIEAAMLRQIAAEREWRTMDTAPRDGTTIIGAKSGKDPFLCYWDDQKGGQWFADLIPGFWHEGVTRWQPLPTPPET